MYKFVLRNLGQNSLINVYESCLLQAKCDKAAAPVFRIANKGGARALSTSSVRLCENKNNAASSNQDDKTNPVEVLDPKGQKAEGDNKVTQMAEQNAEPVVSRGDDGNTTQSQMVNKTEPPTETTKNVMPDPAKSGKESLLNLLGAMKVEVTNKRKFKTVKVKKSYESMSMSTPAAMESTISMFQQATAEASSQSESLDPELIAAASAAASTLPNHSQAESELLKQLRQHEAVTEAQKKGSMPNLGVLITDMKVGKIANRKNAQPVNQIWFDDDGRGYTKEGGTAAELGEVRKRRTLYSGKRLNIFSPTTEEHVTESATARPTLWDLDFAKELSQSSNQMPRNKLEEMIQWTKEGKMWQYPINNEDGLEEEASVSFHEHIFLERHLEEGFPRQGPVRHFMELVVVGLSRNPYLTVQQKKENISWFRDYFQQKEDVLKEAEVYLN